MNKDTKKLGERNRVTLKPGRDANSANFAGPGCGSCENNTSNTNKAVCC